MFDRLKKALVTSFVGAIALGWVFSEAIMHFAYIFSAPIAGWLMRREHRGLIDHSDSLARFSFQDSLPELVKSLSLFLIGYLFLRWLYFITPATTDIASEQKPKAQ